MLNGKHVIAPPKDIAELLNAYRVYETMDELDPYSVDSKSNDYLQNVDIGNGLGVSSATANRLYRKCVAKDCLIRYEGASIGFIS